MLVLELSATNVTVGDQLNASCTGQAITASRTLYINGESVVRRIGADRRSSVSFEATTTWIIDPVQPEDAGEYFCVAGGDNGTHLDSPPQNVTVHISPSATVHISPNATVHTSPNATAYISPNATNLIPPGPTEMEDGGQAFAFHQLVGSGIAVALFILLLIIVISLAVYVFKRRSH